MGREEKMKMENLINNRVKKVRISAIRQFSERVARLDDGIDLTIGQPDFNTPDAIKFAGKKAINENKTFYTSTAGIEGLRRAAASYFKKYDLNYDWRSEVAITNGATQALDTAFRTILDEESEVILAGPAYTGYEPLIKMCGATAVFIDTTENDFRMTADLIEKHLTEKTRCILLSYPSNPVGTILSRKELKEIVDLIKSRDIFVVSDEIYSELIYDSEHDSIASFPEVRDKTIVINGLSKTYSMTGWRVGIMFAPAYIMKEMLKVLLFNASCVSAISQEAGLEALNAGAKEADAMKNEYKKRRDYMYSRLVSMGLTVCKPKAAFYAFPSVKEFGMDSVTFTNRLLHDEHVAVVPGSSFSSEGEGYIRISFANSLDVLEEGLNRLENFIATVTTKTNH